MRAIVSGDTNGSPANFRVFYAQYNCGFADWHVDGFEPTDFPCAFEGDDGQGGSFSGRFRPFTITPATDGIPLPPEPEGTPVPPVIITEDQG